MNKLELLDKKKNLQDSIQSIISVGEAEQRKLNALEDSELNRINGEIENINKQLQTLEDEEKRANIIIKDKKMSKRFSLIEAIRNESERRVQPEHITSIMEEGRKTLQGTGLEYKGGIILPMEYRADIVAASNSAVATDTYSIIEPLRANLVAVQAGAQMLTGLVGNISIPTYSGTTSDWATETGSATDGAGTFGSVTMSPKRLTTYLAVSKQFLIQDSANADALLQKDIIDSIASKLEATIFGKHTAAATKPNGFYTGTPTYTSNGTISWSKVVALETAVDTSNALNGKLGYILHPSLKGSMKTTAKSTGTAVFVMDENGNVNGYPAYSTSNMSSGLQTGTDEYGILFGNWSDLLIGQWGALDITVDPYTLAGDGKVKLVINSYWDVVKRRAASFAIGSLK